MSVPWWLVCTDCEYRLKPDELGMYCPKCGGPTKPKPERADSGHYVDEGPGHYMWIMKEDGYYKLHRDGTLEKLCGNDDES